MVIFNSYVKFPEGKHKGEEISSFGMFWIRSAGLVIARLEVSELAWHCIGIAKPWFGLRRPETLLIKQYYFITPQNIFKDVFHGVCHQHF